MGMDMWFVKLKNNDLSRYDCISHNDRVDEIEQMIANNDWFISEEYTQELIQKSLSRRVEDGVSLDFTQWDNCEDDCIRNYLPAENHYYKEGFYNAEREFCFLDYIVQRDLGTNINFTGDPCCSRKDFSQMVEALNQWMDTKWTGEYEFIVKKEQGFCEDWIIKLESLKDFVEYMNVADKNGFTMWFSV